MQFSQGVFFSFIFLSKGSVKKSLNMNENTKLEKCDIQRIRFNGWDENGRVQSLRTKIII